jgi:flagellar hook-length control protein FliK
LPVEEEVAVEDDNILFSEDILEIVPGNIEQSSAFDSLQSMLQQINYGEIQTQSIDSGSSENETLNSSNSALYSPNTFTNINILNQINNINKTAISGDTGPEILNTKILNSKEGSKTTANLNSLFSGSFTNITPGSVTGNSLPGFDLSSNNQQNSSFNQQFSELQMRLLGQDKLINEAPFDVAKLTQPTTDTPVSSALFETNTFNQPRTISELMIKTPVMDRQWSTEFNNHIAYMSKSGGGNAIIKLNPAHLGPVEATIRVVNEVATIQIAATHITTREAMDAAIPRLKEMLNEQGFTQVNVDISDKGFSQQSDKSNQGTSSANNQTVDEEEGDFSNTESMTVLGKSVSNGVVDYFA